MGVLDIVKPGVLSGDDVSKVYAYAKQQGFAIPAVNVVGSNSINAVLESAKIANSPVSLNEEQMSEVEKLLDKLEDDDDVQAVYTNIE